MNPRIQMMVQSRELEPDAAEDREVLARWRKAVRSYADSRKDLGPDSVLTLSYQAGLQAATAIVRAAGYRVRTWRRGTTASSSKPCAGWGSTVCRRSRGR